MKLVFSLCRFLGRGSPGNAAVYHQTCYSICEFRMLSLSSNCIEKITNLNGLSKLPHPRLLSKSDINRTHDGTIPNCCRAPEDPFSREESHQESDRPGKRVITSIPSPTHLTMVCLIHFRQEAVSETLEQLWVSYNNIEKLKGITVLTKLKVSCI